MKYRRNSVTLRKKAKFQERTRIKKALERLQLYQTQLHAQTSGFEPRLGLPKTPLVKDIQDQVPVGYLTLDKAGCIRDLNVRAAQCLGFPKAWLIDKPFVTFVGSSDVRRFLACLSRAPRSRKISVQLALNGNHLGFLVGASIQRVIKNDVSFFQVTLVDLSDVQRSEAEINAALEKWHSMVENAPDIIMTIDETGKIFFVNRPVWGFTVSKLIGTSIFEHVDAKHDSTIRRCLLQAFSGETKQVCELPSLHETNAWYAFCFGPSRWAFDSFGSSSTTTLIVREITQEKIAEGRLQDASRQLRNLSAKLESVREEERTRVAREIHDELGQALTGLSIDLAWVIKKTPNCSRPVRKKTNEMLRGIDDLIQRVRRISTELRPSILDELGLLPALEWQLMEFQRRTGIRSRLQCSEIGPEIDREKSTAIFRIVQESLTNVTRHASATRVNVSVRTEGHALFLEISDNGRSISDREISDPASLGLIGMRERAKRFGGEFKIRSIARGGTSVEVYLPVQSPITVG